MAILRRSTTSYLWSFVIIVSMINITHQTAKRLFGHGFFNQPVYAFIEGTPIKTGLYNYRSYELAPSVLGDGAYGWFIYLTIHAISLLVATFFVAVSVGLLVLIFIVLRAGESDSDSAPVCEDDNCPCVEHATEDEDDSDDQKADKGTKQQVETTTP